MIRITCLMDDGKSSRRGLESEHGLSYWIEKDGEKFLFDTGSSGLFLSNAAKLGIEMRRMKAVILSHNHYDHAGGMKALVERWPETHLLYTGENFFDRKYSKRSALKLTDLSGGFDEEYLRENGVFHHAVRDVKEIADGAWLVSGFERTHSEETIPERFMREKEEAVLVHDEFEDEVALALDSERGLILIVGCSHPGILNMAETVSKRLGKKIYAVIGGTHLLDSDDERIRHTIRGLEKLGAEVFALSHCSGERVGELLEEEKGEGYLHMAPGDVLFF